MAAVKCYRCGNGGYAGPPVAAPVPSILDVPENTVLVHPELCAGCRARATRENNLAIIRSKQKGQKG